MADKIKYPWQQAVVDAFMSAPQDLSPKINIAERAISARMAESEDLDFDERIALKDASRALGVLITEARSRGRDTRRVEKAPEKPDREKDCA
jgi:hypothetical protein